MLAEGDCADVVTAPGRRVTWETLNLISLCPFLPLYVSQFPFILPYPSFSLAHMNNRSLFHTYANTHRQTQHTTPHSPSSNTITDPSLPLLYLMHASTRSQCSLSPLCCSITQNEFITEKKGIVTPRTVTVLLKCAPAMFCL